jgi:hypothetical protein
MVTQYDKAYAAALTAIITYVVGQVWIDLPEGITDRAHHASCDVACAEQAAEGEGPQAGPPPPGLAPKQECSGAQDA